MASRQLTPSMVATLRYSDRLSFVLYFPLPVRAIAPTADWPVSASHHSPSPNTSQTPNEFRFPLLVSLGGFHFRCRIFGVANCIARSLTPLHPYNIHSWLSLVSCSTLQLSLAFLVANPVLVLVKRQSSPIAFLMANHNYPLDTLGVVVVSLPFWHNTVYTWTSHWVVHWARLVQCQA